MDDIPPKPADESHAEPEPVAVTSDGDEVRDVSLEELEDAFLEGDQPAKVGSIRSALRHRDFRTVFLGMFASNIGTWMQNVIVLAMAYDLTGSAWFVGLVGFANFLPALFLSLVGGAIADQFDRKKLILWLSLQQMIGSLLLAWIALDPDPSQPALLGAVAFIGIGAALQAPIFQSLTPSLVPREDIQGVVSLNSVSMNASRVIGPAIGGVLYGLIGASWVFVGNAATYVFVMIAVTRIVVTRLPRTEGEGPLRRLLGGFTYLRHEPVARRAVTTVFFFTLLCLSFVTQMPVLAGENLGIPAKSATYGALYATFGLGAVVGALSIGTVLAGRPLDRIVRVAFIGFAVSVVLFALQRAPAPAFPAAFIVGFFYFGTMTLLSTIFQSRLDNEIRGRATAVWLMAVMGTGPLANLLGGWLISLTSVTTVMIGGAVIALALAWFADLRSPEERIARAG